MMDALVVIDLDGKIMTINPATLELFGWTEKDLVGSPASVLFDDPAVAQAFSRGSRSHDLAEEGEVRLEEVTCRHRDGDTFPVSLTASVMRNDEGEISGYVGIARDIRVLKRLQQEKILAIRALAASVAHEIRNPLGAIENSVGLLRRDLELDGEDAQLMEIVADESERINSIVTHFLNFARPSELRLDSVDLGLLVEETALLAQRDARCGQGVEVEVNLPDQVLELRGDQDKMRQVIWNLVINGMDALGEAGGKLVIEVSECERNYVCMTVSDDGCGMDEEQVSRALEPFITSKARGTGLGLAIVKGIVEEHGGVIGLASQLGEGTTVTIRLPML